MFDYKQKVKIIPKKSLGQHFLINPRILDKIVDAAEITKEDTILEVGPGTGNLTKKLAEKAKKIIAVEKDGRLIPVLREKFENQSNIEIIEGDILTLDIKKLIRNWKLEIGNSHYKVVGNIPYYITSRFLRTMFTKWPRPKLVVLTIQKEVAQRIIAKPPKMNLLAASVQYFAEPKIIDYISKNNFRPIPKVNSAIIRLDLKPEKRNQEQTEKFFKIVRAGFSQKRKLLVNNISSKTKLGKDKILGILKNLKINLNARAENLSLENWINLANELKLD